MKNTVLKSLLKIKGWVPILLVFFIGVVYANVICSNSSYFQSNNAVELLELEEGELEIDFALFHVFDFERWFYPLEQPSCFQSIHDVVLHNKILQAQHSAQVPIIIEISSLKINC